VRQVFHIYSVLCEQRDALQKYLLANDVDAKVHYPVPMHLQPAAAYLGHKKGDFPVSERLANETISLPVHEFISREQQDKVVNLFKAFYG
jgi:dTDP-4-amino-4,6-dideoxygalactose transaminase